MAGIFGAPTARERVDIGPRAAVAVDLGVPYAIMHQNQWFFIGTQIARELENY